MKNNYQINLISLFSLLLFVFELLIRINIWAKTKKKYGLIDSKFMILGVLIILNKRIILYYRFRY